MVAFLLAACMSVETQPSAPDGADFVDELADSDGDTYLDAWELAEGTDPHDYDSRIYTGFWPYQPDKDALDAPDLDQAQAEVDELLGRFVAMDQHGDFVDVYDFAGHDKPVVLNLCAQWCGPCHELSMWLLNEDADLTVYEGWLGSDIPEAVASGEVLWIEVITEGDEGQLPDPEDLERWYEAYPNEKVPLLGDDGRVSEAYLRYGWPSIWLLDGDLRIQARPTREDHYEALFQLQDELH